MAAKVVRYFDNFGGYLPRIVTIPRDGHWRFGRTRDLPVGLGCGRGWHRAKESGPAGPTAALSLLLEQESLELKSRHGS